MKEDDLCGNRWIMDDTQDLEVAVKTTDSASRDLLCGITCAFEKEKETNWGAISEEGIDHWMGENADGLLNSKQQRAEANKMVQLGNTT